VSPAKPAQPTAELQLDREAGDRLVLRLAGAWTIRSRLPRSAEALVGATRAGVREVAFDTSGLEAWDSALPAFLLRLREGCREAGLECDLSALPEGVGRLIDLASEVPEREDARRSGGRAPVLERVGRMASALVLAARDVLEFLGEVTLSLGRLLVGRAQFRRVDLWRTVQECGANALPIVTLISVLVGMILAFVGAVQLEQFGAEIYVANLVGLAMAREMGAMMTAIIMAGRTGAAFAAQIGTMRVNEEIDALATFDFSPIDFLVLPRALALAAMLPLLCIYADFLGILGGALIGVGMLDLSPALYWDQTVGAVDLMDFGVGLFKSAVFGVLVAIAGCLRGLQCGTSSAAVGEAATSAVVTGIVAIIVFDAIFTVLFDVLGI
jgi:phospholipid/cholesterol/gamma-HCH transport system permease protein